MAPLPRASPSPSAIRPPAPKSTPAPLKSSIAANTPRSTLTPSAARLNALKSPNNTTKSPATTIRLPLIKGAQIKEKPPLPLPKNLANTPSSTAQLRPRPEITTTTLGGGATPARPVIGLDLSPKVRKNSLSTPRTPRSPITKPSSAAKSVEQTSRCACRRRPQIPVVVYLVEEDERVVIVAPVARKSSPVPPLHSKAIATAMPAAAAEPPNPPHRHVQPHAPRLLLHLRLHPHQ
jgi:hypothetical protein